MTTNISTIASYLDERLRTAEIPDYGGALNGLQLANRRDIAHVAAAVDFSTYTARQAVALRADLLIVHHGMFWGGTQPITGQTYERLALLLGHDIAVYSSHLPLDLHPELGNNALLARAMGLEPTAGFARFKGLEIGVSGETSIETSALVERAHALAELHGGQAIVSAHEPGRMTRRWGICTGAGASSETIAEAVERGIDTLVVGEGPHHTAVQARDLGIVIIYAGHYATETLGVRALATELAERFGLEASFIDAPTGL